MQLDDSRLELGRAPVSESAPAGSDIRYDPDFEALDDQIRRMESAGVGAADWQVVADQGATILRQKSKDLLVAAYYAFALWRLERLPGAAIGICILHDLVANFWEQLYPPQERKRGRIAVFQWLTERLGTALADEPEGAPVPEAVPALEALESLSSLLDERLGPDEAGLGPLIRALRPLAEKAKAAAAPVQAAQSDAPAAPSAAQPASADPSPQVAPPSALDATPENLDHAIEVLRESQRQVGLAMLARSALDGRAYGLLAGATWLPVSEPPPAQGGRTTLPPPTAEQLHDLDARQAGEPAGLVIELQRFCSGPGLFWLDGQRRTAEALERLGDPGKSARQAHAAAVDAALQRLPGLEALAFADGTSFADAETRQWLASLGSAAAGGGPGAGAAPGVDGAGWAHGASEAHDLLAAGRTDEAVERLSAGARQARTGQERLHWLLEQLRLCLEIPDLVVGMGLARSVTALVDSHRLEDWDPPLAAEALQLAYLAVSHQEAGGVVLPEERGALSQQWMARLALLDAARGRAALHPPQTH